MVNSFNYSYLRLDECNVLGSRIVAKVETFDVTALGLLPVVEPVKNILQKLDEGLNKGNVKIETMSVKNADGLRDDCVTGLNYYCKAYACCMDETKRMAAKRLLETIAVYGSIVRENLSVETSKIDNLLGDIDKKPKLQEAVDVIEGQFFEEQLRQAQTNFKAAVKERVVAKDEQSDVDNQKTVLELKDALYTLFQFVEVMQKVNPKPEFAAIIKQINIIIDETMAAVNIRQGRRVAEKESENVN
ncbi:hypothetical protein DMA11_08760 [Marinilabiliaceae bacterium JC017]|nr:hypothetical protein DMA11_08760 [Marinilabiliaceae bacterium JC017]